MFHIICQIRWKSINILFRIQRAARNSISLAPNLILAEGPQPYSGRRLDPSDVNHYQYHLNPWNSLVFHLLIEIHIYHGEVNWRLDEESHFTTSWSNSPSIMLWADKKQFTCVYTVPLDFSPVCRWIFQWCAVGFARTVDFWAAKALGLLCISL